MCSTEGCDNETKGGRTYCTKCRSRKWRTENPFKYHWYNLRNRARQRGKHFDLTLQEFKKLWLRHPEKWKEKLESEGLSPWDIDRKDNTKGYIYSNLQIISKNDNMRKFHEEDKHALIEEEVPF